MKIYVDGNDLLEYFDEEDAPLSMGRDDEDSRGNLARWLARYCEASDCDALLVFDETGADEVLPPTEHVGRVTVINLPYGVEARTEIAGPANRNAVDERTFVVTSDYRLAQAMERGKARTMEPDQFVRRVRRLMHKDDEGVANEPDEKFSGLTDEEVGFWLEYFNDED